MIHQGTKMRALGSCLFAVILAAGLAASSGSPQVSTDPQTVDAATFVLAVQQGRAAEYKGRVVSGTGADFHGSSPSLDLTVGTATADGPPKPIATWDEFAAAQRARTTLVVSLKVAGFKRTSWPRRGQKPAEYWFSGAFHGAMKTIPRMGGTSGDPDSGPCAGQPFHAPTVSSGPMTYHCVPVLDGVKIEQR